MLALLYGLGMCVMVILFLFGFGSVFEKNSDLVRNEFGSVQFEKLGSVRIL